MKIKKEVSKRILMEEIERQIKEDALSSMTGGDNKDSLLKKPATTSYALADEMIDTGKAIKKDPNSLKNVEVPEISKMVSSALETGEKEGNNTPELKKMNKVVDQVSKQSK